MKTEDVGIEFTEDGINQMVDAAWRVNETTETSQCVVWRHRHGTPNG